MKLIENGLFAVFINSKLLFTGTGTQFIPYLSQGVALTLVRRLPDRSHQNVRTSNIESIRTTIYGRWSQGAMFGPILECDKIVNIWTRKLVKVLFYSYL